MYVENAYMSVILETFQKFKMLVMLNFLKSSFFYQHFPFFNFKTKFVKFENLHKYKIKRNTLQNS